MLRILAIFGLLIVCSIVYYSGYADTEKAHKVSSIKSEPVSAQGAGAKNDSGLPTIELPRTSYSSRADENKSEIAKAIQEYGNNVDSFKGLLDSIEKEDSLRKMFEAMRGSSPDQFAKVSKLVLTDLEYIDSHFDSNQALARVFAIKYLTFLMTKGDYRYSVETIGGISNIHRSNREYPGIALDLEQLVFHLVDSNPLHFSDNFESFAESWGIDENNHIYFENAIAMGLRNHPQELRSVSRSFNRFYGDQF